MREDHERFMRFALHEAELCLQSGDAPVGSVIVRNGEVIARGRNATMSTGDVTAHAELAAIRELSLKHRVVNPGFQANSGPLAGCILYTTIECCPMCCWAACVAGISMVVIGARFTDTGDLRHGDFAIEKLVTMGKQNMKILTGVLVEECVRVRVRGSPIPSPR
jgi:tRNA(Arg) A34 adenosine deaminase TadA